MTNSLLGQDFFALEYDLQLAFVDAINEGAHKKFTFEQVKYLEELLRLPVSTLSNKEKFVLIGYSMDKLKREQGNVAVVKVQGVLMKEATKRGVHGIGRWFKRHIKTGEQAE
jgi:hypothetical protein